jgi:RES domain-containing protein
MSAIYASTSYAIAALESLVHSNLAALSQNLLYVEASLPDGLVTERADIAQLGGWDSPDMSAGRTYGKAWLQSGRGLVLLVPCVVTRGLDWNAVINPAHPDFARITVSSKANAVWDNRLRVTIR